MKPFKTKSKLILKNVVVCRYGEITFKILRKEFIKSIRIKTYLNISITYPLGTKNLTNKKKFISKRLLKTRSNFYASKVHNYHLVKVSQKQISHSTL
jgi:hypothetical protein